ncbi:hypothetical protein MPH_08674, partial [Macrophomina phaseolina MS6]
MTWIEDNSSTFKEESSDELGKAKAGIPEATENPHQSAQAKGWDHDLIGSRLHALEKQNKNLMRKVERLQNRRIDEDERRAVIEEYVKKKKEEETWEKSIREAAVAEYKAQLRIENEKEQERRKVLMHEARQIEDRAQDEMNQIYRQTGEHIIEADQRHQNEIFQIQQRLNSGLRLVERRIREQIESSAWGIEPDLAEDAQQGKGQRVSFEPMEQAQKHESGEVVRDSPQKISNLQIPANRASGGSANRSANRPSEVSQIAPETPITATFPTDAQNLHSSPWECSTEYHPVVAAATWKRRGHTAQPVETPTSLEQRPSRLRRLAKTLRLTTVGHNDINVIKVPKRGQGSPVKPKSAGKRRVSSFMARHRRVSSMQKRHPSQGSSPDPIPEHPGNSEPADRQAPPAQLSLLPTGDEYAMAFSQLPASTPY